MIRVFALFGIGCVTAACVFGQTNSSDPLSYLFDGKYGQVEVGGKFVGTEFHRSRPLPSRISFYYPVANSIDMSTDYWKRDQSMPMTVAVQVNNGTKRWIGKEPWVYTVSPHRVTFEREAEGLQYSMSYEFCMNEPAMVFSLKIKNTSGKPVNVSAYSHLKLALRTCQTYARKDSAWTSYDSANDAVIAQFDDPETHETACFVQNVGTKPAQWTTSAEEVGATNSGSSSLLASPTTLQGRTFTSGRKGIPVAAFVYERSLRPGEFLNIVQVIGSANGIEVNEKVKRLATSWKSEVAAYDAFVRKKALEEVSFTTGDAWLDRSAVWARAILASNAHYIDGVIVPMPCPAEYNFFFTHDVLMTNLAVVNFDLPRVKKDLLHIASLGKDGIIPHAYYWRDDGFKTEFCTPDNWNHLWFVLVSASYLRHSHDDSTAAILYPLVTKSLEEILKQKKPDNLMYGFRPDWWDIGHVEGPRAYLTILTIRALREYLFINSALGQFSSSLIQYERLADSIQTALSHRLWNEQSKYLMDSNGNTPDPHYYMGSLLAATFGVLSREKSTELVATATKELVDARIGVRCVMPVDFHTPEAIAFFKFAGDEAGQPYYYINGGVWPHNNAWYALALKNVGMVDEATDFVERTMTLDGIANSPMGIPAMYEYRFSDSASAEFGKIDKPSFLWAGGFYLYTLYHLFGIEENEWNVSIAGPLPSATPSARYSFAFGELKLVNVHGNGNRLRTAFVDDKELPSLVLPVEKMRGKSVNVEFGTPERPYLERVNARLHSVRFDAAKKSLLLNLSSFKGHNTVTSVVVMKTPKKVVLDGRTQRKYTVRTEEDGVKVLTISFAGSDKHQILEIVF